VPQPQGRQAAGELIDLLEGGPGIQARFIASSGLAEVFSITNKA